MNRLTRIIRGFFNLQNCWVCGRIHRAEYPETMHDPLGWPFTGSGCPECHKRKATSVLQACARLAPSMNSFGTQDALAIIATNYGRAGVHIYREGTYIPIDEWFGTADYKQQVADYELVGASILRS